MRLLHVPRSSLSLLAAGFVAGILLTMSAVSFLKDGSSDRVIRTELNTELHVPLRHHHEHGHHRSGSDDVKVVDLAEQDKHKHTGISSASQQAVGSVCRVPMATGNSVS